MYAHSKDCKSTTARDFWFRKDATVLQEEFAANWPQSWTRYYNKDLSFSPTIPMIAISNNTTAYTTAHEIKKTKTTSFYAQFLEFLM